MEGPHGLDHNGPMPWLLYRYILRELLKVFALTASVLVLIIAFGAAIKPLAGDDLIGPAQTAKYILLAIDPHVVRVDGLRICSQGSLILE